MEPRQGLRAKWTSLLIEFDTRSCRAVGRATTFGQRCLLRHSPSTQRLATAFCFGLSGARPTSSAQILSIFRRYSSSWRFSIRSISVAGRCRRPPSKWAPLKISAAFTVINIAARTAWADEPMVMTP